MNVSKSIMQKLSRAALALTVCLLTLTSAFALTNEQHVPKLNNLGKKLFAPSAKFDRIWVDYDVAEDGQDGMRIHLKFTTYGMKELDSAVRINFQTNDGKPLKDKNQRFYTTSGNVALFTELKPGYPTTVYNDLQMFMPYEELDLEQGNYSLKMDVDLIYEDGTLIQHMAYEAFTYDNAADDAETNAVIKKVWVDYNVSEDRRKGMRIHVNFEVTGLKGVDSKLVVRVQKESGDFLTSSSPSYANDSGQLELSFSMKPGYPTTVYEDATIFLPYDEIIIRKGVWDLKLDIDLNYESGELINHLTYHEFEFTR
jgi:hypothetical protein